jgi:hypothetical protein
MCVGALYPPPPPRGQQRQPYNLPGSKRTARTDSRSTIVERYIRAGGLLHGYERAQSGPFAPIAKAGVPEDPGIVLGGGLRISDSSWASYGIRRGLRMIVSRRPQGGGRADRRVSALRRAGPPDDPSAGSASGSATREFPTSTNTQASARGATVRRAPAGRPRPASPADRTPSRPPALRPGRPRAAHPISSGGRSGTYPRSTARDP